MENIFILSISVLILWLQLGWVSCQQKVEQTQFLSVQEGDSATLNCNYTDSAANYFLWYHQSPGKGPALRIASYSSSDVKEGRFTISINKGAKQFSLHISDSQLVDSGSYFCESEDNQRLFWGSGTSLTVIPNIKDPQPALYQLTSPKSSDTSVCLLTDFDSSNTYTNGNDSTVLEMMTMESKSYGAVAWGSKSSFNCTNAFPQNIINLTQPSGSTCKVQDVEQSFETDKDLNLMNASLIFLRVIFLKTVGFNLLMTLRLWSN